MCSYKNHKFTNEENTLAVIYIVRDPRNLATSLSNHFSLSLENSKQFLFSQSRRIIEKPKEKFKKNNDVFIHLENWGNHYKSWKNLTIALVKIVKYEDLVNNTIDEVIKISNFLSDIFKIDKKKLCLAFDGFSASGKSLGAKLISKKYKLNHIYLYYLIFQKLYPIFLNLINYSLDQKLLDFSIDKVDQKLIKIKLIFFL